MMKFILSYVAILIAAFCLDAVAQNTLTPFINTPNYYRPKFEDSLRLFYVDTVIWRCHYENTPNDYYYPISETNFQMVDTCKCISEKYQKVSNSQFSYEGIYNEEGLQLVNKKLYGYIARKEKNDFVYIEVDSNGQINKTVEYEFYFSDVVAIDSLIIIDPVTLRQDATVYSYFKVKKK